jgi:hypothetical protein
MLVGGLAVVEKKRLYKRGPNTHKLLCFLTAIFALPESLSHVTSAAFTQARLRLGSGSAQAQLSQLKSAHLIYATRRSQDPSHQKSLTFNEGPEKAPSTLVRDPKYITDRRGDSDSEGCFRPLMNFTY